MHSGNIATFELFYGRAKLVPRNLLKYSKRDMSCLYSPHSRNILSTQLLSDCLDSTPHHTVPGSSLAAIPAQPPAFPPVTTTALQQATFRGIIEDVNSLKDEIISLKMDILALNKSKQPSTIPKLMSYMCYLFQFSHVKGGYSFPPYLSRSLYF